MRSPVLLHDRLVSIIQFPFQNSARDEIEMRHRGTDNHNERGARPPHMTRWSLIAAALAIARADHGANFDTSHPYYIVTSLTSRSPNEYIHWGSSTRYCTRGSDDYSLSGCVPSEPLVDSIPPAHALWWLVPVNITEPHLSEEVEGPWYYIVGSLNSTQPGMVLSFDDWGYVYPKPYWLGQPDYLDELSTARFRFVESHDDSDFTQYYIICGQRSGQAGKMVFINRNLHDWIATWSVDLEDSQATWRMVPAECGDVSCALPDFEEVFNNYDRWQWWYAMLICFGALFVLRCVAECGFRSEKEYSRRSVGRPSTEIQEVTAGEGYPSTGMQTVMAVPVDGVQTVPHASVTVVQASRV